MHVWLRPESSARSGATSQQCWCVSPPRQDAVEARRQVDFVLLLPSRIRPPEKEASREPRKMIFFVFARAEAAITRLAAPSLPLSRNQFQP